MLKLQKKLRAELKNKTQRNQNKTSFNIVVTKTYSSFLERMKSFSLSQSCIFSNKATLVADSIACNKGGKKPTQLPRN